MLCSWDSRFWIKTSTVVQLFIGDQSGGHALMFYIWLASQVALDEKFHKKVLEADMNPRSEGL